MWSKDINQINENIIIPSALIYLAVDVETIFWRQCSGKQRLLNPVKM